MAIKKDVLDRIFVKRYRVGIKGTSKFNELIVSDSLKDALKKYAFARGFRSVPKHIIGKK